MLVWWHFVGANTSDDGYILTMARVSEHAGYMANYYRWLALTYVTTLTTHPALSLPCGLDDAGMPFGLQIVGRFRADRHTLGVGHALEQAFKGIAGLARPRPDIAKLMQTRAEPALTSIVTEAPDPRDARSLARADRAASAAQVSAV